MNTKSPPTVYTLITDGLGYCCFWAFFTRNKRTAMIAARLGVSTRVIRRHKARFYEGQYTCDKCDNCLKKKGLSG